MLLMFYLEELQKSKETIANNLFQKITVIKY
jgi:hypothetical protein